MNFLDEWLAQTEGHANNLDRQGNPARGLFLIGTDTDVGKTYVAQLLIRQLAERGLRVGAYKPVASGIVEGVAGDAERLHAATGLDWPIDRVCPQRFAAALAPPVAARREGRRVDEALLRSGAAWWRDKCEVLVVEGAGGGLSPIADRTTVLDLAVDVGYEVILVAEHRLGMMNQVLLTLEALQRRALKLAGLVINHPNSATNGDVQLHESLECMLPFCGDLLGKMQVWVVSHRGSALSRAFGSATIQG